MDEIKINLKKIVLNLIFVLLLSFFAFFLIGWLYHRGSFISLFHSIRPSYLLFALGLTILEWFLEALRIQKIIHALGRSINYGKVLRVTLIGSFFAKITPFDTGGEPFQIYFLQKDRELTLGESTAVIMIKTLLGHFSRLFLGILLPFLVILFWKKWFFSKTARILIYLGMPVYLGFIFFLLFVTLKPQIVKKIIFYFSHIQGFLGFGLSRIKKWLGKLSQTIDDFEQAKQKILTTEPADLVMIGFLSLLCWTLVILLPLILLYGMGVHSPILQTLTIAIIFYIATAYAPTPGSSGAAELGFATLFAVLVPKPLLGIFVLIWRLISYYSGLLIGGAVTLREVVRHKFKHR